MSDALSCIPEDLPPLPRRPLDSHKGTFGTVLIVGGSDDGERMMIGAPALAANAALRAGCGLAQLAMPASILASGLELAPCATGVALPQDARKDLRPSDAAERIGAAAEHAGCVAIGPGLGVGHEQQQLIMWALGSLECPVVLDADGLNNLAAVSGFGQDIKGPTILTPHPGEFARLAAALGMDVDATADDRRAAAAELLAQRLGCVVILKGAGTVVSDGARTWTAPFHEPALATGGTGDVLTGVTASLVAQFFRPHLGSIPPSRFGALDLYETARWAVILHGLAAARWAERHGHAGLLASELPDLIPDVLRDIRARESSDSRRKED